MPLKIFVYDGMGIGFISFVIINIFLIISFFSKIDNFILGIISLTLILIISFIGFIFGHIIFLKKLKFSSYKIKKKSSFIFISDIHLGTNSITHLKKILNKIKILDYDFILIGGDLIDSSSFNLSELSIFKNISKPIYFVTGNHEYYIKNFENKLSQLSDLGIITLNNKNTHINNINLIGIDDKQTPEFQYKNYIKLRSDGMYNLLLVHKPSIWDKVKDNADLMLSGHCHNGQIMPFNFLVKLQFKYLYGLYKNKNSNLYISSGVACWGPRLRVGTINEILHIEIDSN